MRRKGPLPGKICAPCIPERRFAALFGCMARESCQTQLVLDARRRYVAREGRFSRPRPLRGCMRRENCHEWPPGNAPRRNLAIARRLGTHFASIPPSPNRRERIEGRTLPWRRPPWSAPRRNLAAVERWGQLARRLREAAQRARRICSPGFTRAARKARPRAEIREAARHAHQVRTPGSKGGSTRKTQPRAGNSRGGHNGFAKQLDAQGQQGTKKAPLRRTAPFPHNYGRKPDPP